MKKVILPIFLLTAISCQFLTTEEDTIGAYGIMKDATTNAPIESVLVTLTPVGYPNPLDNLPSTHTDSNGYYDIWLQGDRNDIEQVTKTSLSFERSGCISFSIDSSTNGYNNLNLSVNGEITLCNSMKGWELYAWRQTETDYFTLIYGTNAIKATDVITSDIRYLSGECLEKVKATKLNLIESVLENIPVGELLMYGGPPDGYDEPPTEVTDAIKTYCDFK